MSLHFEYPADLEGDGPVKVLSLAWSRNDHPILAVSTSNGSMLGTIYMVHEEGEKLEPDAKFKRQGVCRQMAWHPRASILATGWDDGVVASWTEKERVVREDSVTHNNAITFMEWSPDGSRLITGDRGGVLGVWQGDARGRLVLVCRYKKHNAITHLAFRAPAGAYMNHLDTCPAFFFGGGSGMIYFGDDQNRCSEVVNLGSAVNSMFYSHKNDYLVVVTVDVVLYKYNISSSDGKMMLDKKVKLSIKGDGSDLQCVWAGAGLLAAANNEGMIRMWHLEKDDNYTLSLGDSRHMSDLKDTIRTLAFNPRTRSLAGGCASGKVVFWKFIGEATNGQDPSDEDWDVLPSVDSSAAINNMVWGPTDGLLAISSAKSASVLNQTDLHCKTFQGNTAIQMSTDSMYVQTTQGHAKKVTTSIRIKGIEINEEYVVVWNGKKVEVRELRSGQVNVKAVFPNRARACALRGETLYAIGGQRLEICNTAGVVKKSITFAESEGAPLLLDVSHDHLVVTTSTGTLKLWDISRSEPKQVVPGRAFEEINAVIKSIKINCNGTKVSMVVNHDDGSGIFVPDTKLWVYDVELDKCFPYEFGPAAYPTHHTWDLDEPRLLGVEAKKFDESVEDADDPSLGFQDDDDKGKRGESDALTLFCTSDYGILMQDSFPVHKGQAMLGLEVPHLLFMTRPKHSEEQSSQALPGVKKRTLRDFVGLENVNDEVKADLMSFSYYLTVGNMDEAYRAVKKIQSDSIWENMAHMCVKTKRLDVAEVCLGNMNNARGAKAVREAKKEPEKEARIAMVAIQLNLLDDAERLYKECGRWDLLIKLYQAAGRWKDAIKICSKYDRIHLKTTHYLYAKHLESVGETMEAIKYYELSDTHKHEVPRMLFDAQHIGSLEEYIKSSGETSLVKWWAQYCESNGQYDEAIKYYQQANETLALVRVYCYRGQDDKAAEICNQTGDAAACYHFARQLENQEKIKEAIAYYTRAKRFNHGVRLAKEHFYENELMQLALESNKQLKLESAQYFEGKGLYDKAVLLYQKGGKVNKALDLCFRANLFESLRIIAENLGSETDPSLLARCGSFFMDNGQYDKAVHLFITAKNYSQALELCMQHNVRITDKMAELLTPAKTEDKAHRIDVLEKLANCCKDQGSYHLACKKFTQAGDKIQAMKCLLKSADTEKIIYYASMTKKREIFILAANYLQTLGWHNEPEIMKTIISFYTKAKAMQQLSVFYDACAQVEIDEYRDYEKALGALKEALKYIIKANDMAGKEEKLQSLDQRIRLVEQFAQARKMVKTNPSEMLKVCNMLLDQPSIESAIRVGDVFALMIEYYHSQREFQDAYAVMKRMQRADIILSPYLDHTMVRQIHDAVGATMPREAGAARENEVPDDDDDDIGEEIGSEM